MTEPVRYEVDNGVATVTLNRPDAMNSLDTATKVALRDTVEQAASDPAARAVLLTGTGRAFCVGQDLTEHAQAQRDGDGDLGATIHEHYNPTVRALATMPKPVIAAVNGIAAGAGASYAFACDFRVLADTAGFNLAFTGIGLSCDTGSSWTLPRLVGWAKARELLMLPRNVDADQARELGLATEVVPADQLLPRARQLAEQLAAGPTLAYAAVRRVLHHSATQSFDDALEYEAEMMQFTGNTQDHHDAVQAFLTKQQPSFHGR